VERIEKCCVKFIKQRIIVQLQLYGIIIIIIIGVNPLQEVPQSWLVFRIAHLSLNSAGSSESGRKKQTLLALDTQ
jgi:hypothetical protein